MKELTLQEYYELIQGEGLLFKSFYDEMMMQHTSHIPSTQDIKTNEFPLVICTNEEDRFKDVLDPTGCITDNFSLNPLFMWEHGKRQALEDSILGKINSIGITRTGIIANAQYVMQDHNPLVKKIYDMELKGLIPGNSIGWKPVSDIRIDEQGRRHVGKWELLDVSKVVIPVNGKATNKQLDVRTS